MIKKILNGEINKKDSLKNSPKLSQKSEENYELSDEQLILQAKDNNNFAFKSLFNKYKIQVYNFIFHMINHRETAEDIFQETFIKAFMNIKRFNSGNFKSWLFTIAKNLVIDNHRKTKNIIDERYVIGEDSNIIENIPANNDLYEDINVNILDAIDSLPKEQQIIFNLKIFGGLKFKEIAKIQNLPLNTVISRMHYALGKLRGKLKEYV